MKYRVRLKSIRLIIETIFQSNSFYMFRLYHNFHFLSTIKKNILFSAFCCSKENEKNENYQKRFELAAVYFPMQKEPKILSKISFISI